MNSVRATSVEAFSQTIENIANAVEHTAPTMRRGLDSWDVCTDETHAFASILRLGLGVACNFMVIAPRVRAPSMGNPVDLVSRGGRPVHPPKLAFTMKHKTANAPKGSWEFSVKSAPCRLVRPESSSSHPLIPTPERATIVISSRPKVVSRNLSFESAGHVSLRLGAGTGRRLSHDKRFLRVGRNDGRNECRPRARDFSTVVEMTNRGRLLWQARRLPAGKKSLFHRDDGTEEGRGGEDEGSLWRRGPFGMTNKNGRRRVVSRQEVLRHALRAAQDEGVGAALAVKNHDEKRTPKGSPPPGIDFDPDSLEPALARSWH